MKPAGVAAVMGGCSCGSERPRPPVVARRRPRPRPTPRATATTMTVAAKINRLFTVIMAAHVDADGAPGVEPGDEELNGLVAI